MSRNFFEGGAKGDGMVEFELDEVQPLDEKYPAGHVEELGESLSPMLEENLRAFVEEQGFEGEQAERQVQLSMDKIRENRRKQHEILQEEE